MIKFLVISGGGAVCVMQGKLFPDKPRLAALAAGQQDQADRAAFVMADQAKALWLQANGSGAAAELTQPLRLVNQKKVTAVLECPARGCEKLRRGAAVIPPGQRDSGTGGTAGKIRGIGHAAAKGAGGKQTVHCPQIGAYTVHTRVKTVAADIFHCCGMGDFVQFNTGDGALRIFRAKQYTQCTAAGA